MFDLMISRSSLKLGYLGSKSRSLDQIKGKACQHSSGHIFEAIIIKLAQNICLMSSRAFETGSFGVKTRSPGQIKETPC